MIRKFHSFRAVSGLALLAGLSASGPAQADADWLFDLRARYETVSQDGFSENAQALTLRTRFGVETALGSGFSVLAEGEHIWQLVDDFNDTTNGRTGFPVVADPDLLQLNRLQLRYAGEAGTSATLGRQRIVRGDARYIGNVGFRQNEQTFDALFLTHEPRDGLSLSYACIGGVNRIFGTDHPAGELDTVIHAADASLSLAGGQLGGFFLLAEFDDLAALSSATFGANWRGTTTLTDGLVLSHFAELAHQSDHGNAPRAFDLLAVRAEAGLTRDGFTGRLGVEWLDGDGSQGFATPLATLHKFQGWADAFLTTPADGIRDLYVQANYQLPVPEGVPNMTVTLAYHDFETANGGIALGAEFDAELAARLSERLTLRLRAAVFDGAAAGPADREKVWLSLDFAL
jgi:hypothetical protein